MSQTTKKAIHIGGASGYWGESAMATPQLLAHPNIDYLVYDYLAEITMSIMARQKAKDPNKGYAADFVDFVMRPHLDAIAQSQVKIIANAGGVNPKACGEAVRALVKEKGLELKVAIITGDDFMANKDKIAQEGLRDMFSGAPFPSLDKIMSINAYLGALPIAKALEAGADIVITGRCVDSAVTLGACIHEFGWTADDFDLLASGSLAGHILECGPQATGGNFTDWEEAGDISNIGYPIAEINADGSFVTTKPEGTGGIVNVGTISEQMLYEIGNPQAYFLPDVTCDFSQVQITQEAENRVRVSPARGFTPPDTYKTCLTYRDGYRGGTFVTLYGGNATAKAKAFANAVLTRANKTLHLFNFGEYREVSTEILGAGSQFGTARDSDEIVMKIAVKHDEAKAVGIFLKELAGMGLATPPGLSGFTGAGRAKPSPVVRLFSYKTDKKTVKVEVEIDGTALTYIDPKPVKSMIPAALQHLKPAKDGNVDVPLIKLAWARSGDKGNKANIGVIARKPEYLPYIWGGLTQARLADLFEHFDGKYSDIERFYLPGSNAINILIDNVLGGGGAASLRNDAQAKGYSQILLAQPITVTEEIASELGATF